MNQYTVKELQNSNSKREGECFNAKNLSAAKRVATRLQVFKGTVLELSNAYGVLSRKIDGVWNDADD